jgi:O-antigen/teichoic acid export membrane protein
MVDSPGTPVRRPPERRTHAGGETISRNALFAFAMQMSTASFTAALTIFLTRALGPAAFGTLSLAMSITGLLRRATAGATSQAVARYVAERRGDAAGVVGVLGMALRIRLLTAAGLAAGFVILSGPIANAYGAPELLWPLRGVALALFGQSILGFATSVFMALRRTSWAFTAVTAEAAMEFSASVALVLLGGGAAGAAFGRAIGYTFGGVVSILLIARFVGRSPVFRTGRSPVARREFAGYAGAMLIVTSASAVFSQIDVLILGAVLSTTAVGIYSGATRLIPLIGYPGLAMAQAVGPRLARHPDEPPNVRALGRSLGYMVIVQLAITTLLLVWAAPIIRLTLGPEFSESAEVLRALTPFVFLSGLTPMVVSPLNYAGEGRRRIPISIASVALAAVLDLILIQEIGILGAAVGGDISYAVFAAGNLWLANRILGLPLMPLTVSLGRSLVAAAGMGAVLALIGTGELSAIGWIGGLLGGFGVYLAILLATRELSIREIRFLARLPVKALRGDPPPAAHPDEFLERES